MRKITVIEFVSLDGVVQAPGGPEEDTSGNFKYGGWTAPYFDEFSGQVMSDQMSLKHSELLLGRVTYDIFSGYWPQHGDGWPGINDVKKYVVSHNSGLKLSWNNAELISGDIVQKLTEIKKDEGPDLRVWGSSNLVHTLLKHDLIDELWLKIFPVVLGSGKRLFTEGATPSAFNLVDSKVSPLGVIIANYERAGEVKTGAF
jgi:dihydrofolate reductase